MHGICYWGDDMGLKRKMIEIIEKPITDATAVPSNVAKGKVFYNNDGRQVGISDAIQIKTISRNCTYGQGSYSSVNTSRTEYSIHHGNGNVSVKNYNGSFTIGGNYHYKDIFNNILSITINGIEYPVSHNKEDPLPKILRVPGWSDDLVQIWKNHVFIKPTSNNRDITFSMKYI